MSWARGINTAAGGALAFGLLDSGPPGKTNPGFREDCPNARSYGEHFSPYLRNLRAETETEALAT